MKRFHVHVGVENLPQAIGFYSTLFATRPAVVKPDYAKWMLDDPRVNFAISTRGKQPGLDHLGIQVESKDELHDVYERLRHAGLVTVRRAGRSMIYAARYDSVRALLAYLSENCCEGAEACAPAPCAPAQSAGRNTRETV